MTTDGNFTAIDIETANNSLSSICEIGVARFRECVLIESWRALINPETNYEPFYHTKVHGLAKCHTANACTFPEVFPILKRFVEGEVCIYHASSDFDRNSIAQACERYGLEDITSLAEWVSTLSLAQACWPDHHSHKLTDLADKLQHQYEPHNALEDAIACAVVYRAALGLTPLPSIQGTAIGPDGLRTYRTVKQSGTRSGAKSNPNGLFYGVTVVLTGSFSPPWEDRNEFKRYLNQIGFTTPGNITKKTKLLVTGSSPGPRKVKTAREAGLQIMNEHEFLAFLTQAESK